MALTFEYRCNHCAQLKTNHELDSFACNCGGNYVLQQGQLLEVPVFDAYYDPSVETYLTSYREQEKVGRKFRSKAHPKGLSIRQDTKFHRETEYIKKHKEDYLQMQYKQRGLNYKPGSKATVDNATGQLTTTSRRTYFI